MKWLTNWFIDNPVAANLLMVTILVGGLLSLETIRVESFPQIPPSWVKVTVTYPGGTARQVDQSITQRVEDAVSSLPGISRISASSMRGYSEVNIKKTSGTDLERLLDDIRNQVNAITDFPALAERPQVMRDEFTNLASYILVYGDVSDVVLQQATERTVKALKRHPDISQVENLGQRKPELIIEPRQNAMRKYKLDISQLHDRISRWSLEYRSGELKTAQGSLILRSDYRADSLLKLKQLPVLNTPEGTITLEQIADVRRGYQETDSIVRFQGQPATAILVSTSRKDNLLKVSESVKQVLVDIKPSLPVNVQLDTMADMAPYIKDQLNRLGTNAWQGLLIVVLLLGLFLNVKLAFWVAVGIPVSMAGAIWLMGPVDYSINDITLFGMILVLGVLVDDAVVVGESIHEARGRIADQKAAARSGVEAVAVATVFGVLTTIAAFSPMLWIDNELAKVLAGFSGVVILALLFSLIESKFILPAHLSHMKDETETPWLKWLTSARHFCLDKLDKFTAQVYLPLLNNSLNNKIASLLIFSSFMILAYGLITNGSIKSAFFPEIPGRYAQAKVTMDMDAPLPLALNGSRKVEQALAQVNQSLTSDYGLASDAVVRTLVSTEGAGAFDVVAELSSEALSAIPGNELLERWQKASGSIEGAYAVKFSSAEEPAGGTSITIAASDRDIARQVAQRLKTKLIALPGVNDVYDDSQGGQRQLQLVLNQRGRQLGITQQQLAVTVGSAYGESEVQRLLLNGEETKVLIRLAVHERRTQAQLENTLILTERNGYVTLGEVADFFFSREPSILYRKNRDEVVTLYWRQDRGIASPEETWSKLEETSVMELENQYPGVSIKAAGEFEEISEVQGGFKKALLLTLLLIYVLLAIPLKSYFQPLIIMSVIPFGYAGAIYGHGLMDLPVSLLSLFGMMAMTGVVINDSLVLMTRFNQNFHDKGMAVKEALLEAGKSRLRAIFLTTITTVCGLIPLLLESSEQAQYLKPAAVSLVFGELFATPITLLLIPVLVACGKYKRNPTANYPQELAV